MQFHTECNETESVKVFLLYQKFYLRSRSGAMVHWYNKPTTWGVAPPQEEVHHRGETLASHID